MRGSEIYYPKSLAELLELMKADADLLLYAGGTELLRRQGSRYAAFPPSLALIDRIPELRQISLSERFIEIGAALTLSEILELKESALPELLAQAIKGIASPGVRSIATLGGNIAARERFMDIWPALACLDALLEFRDHSGSRWVNVSRLVDDEGKPYLPPGSIIVKARIPLEIWDISLLKKVGNRSYPGHDTAVFSAAARAEKGILTEFRLAFAGEQALRRRDIEGAIIGKKLPLSVKDCSLVSSEYRKAAAELAQGLRSQFAALVDGCLELLAG